MMASAPARLRSGMLFLTVFSCSTTSIAIQPGRVRRDTVGFLSAGRTFITRARFFSSRFIFMPTIPSALRAPCKRMEIFSTFCFFHGFCSAFGFAINRGGRQALIHNPSLLAQRRTGLRQLHNRIHEKTRWLQSRPEYPPRLSLYFGQIAFHQIDRFGGNPFTLQIFYTADGKFSVQPAPPPGGNLTWHNSSQISVTFVAPVLISLLSRPASNVPSSRTAPFPSTNQHNV